MSDLHLHVISFDIPYPANYGGVIDVYYKLLALHEYGIKTHLHCFEYGRNQSKKLEQICQQVYYYKRDISKKNLFRSTPYIVSSRTSTQLVKNLLKDDYPILMEGLHTSALLGDKRFSSRKLLVRTHNIEHEYYQNLAKVEQDLFKKYYFFNEAGKLKKYENQLKKADLLLTISQNDHDYFSSRFKNVDFIPAFHPHKKVKAKKGRGKYALYHGNLSVGENYHAARHLVTQVFNDLNIPLIIAGLNPGRQMIQLAASSPNVELVTNPSDKELFDLINNAQLNITITAQATGLKLKLLNALYNGRYCVVNDKMLSGSSLDELCLVANDASTMKKLLIDYFKKSFSEEEIEIRKQKLGELYNNGHNIEKLIGFIR